MSDYSLNAELFIQPTPGGVFFMSCDPSPEPARQVLEKLLRLDESPSASADGLSVLANGTSSDEDMELVYRMQQSGWLSGVETPVKAPDYNIEEDFPDLLGKLSSKGKAILADDQGFYLAKQGIPHESAEEISALCGDLMSVLGRHQGLLKNNLRIKTDALSIVDAAGFSQLGFWPLFIGEHRFSLIIMGQPNFTSSQFVDLVWSLCRRYL